MKTKTLLLDLGGVVFQSTGISNHIIDWSIITKLNNKYGHALNIGTIELSIFLDEYNLETQQNLQPEEFLSNIFDTLEFNKELLDFLKGRFDIYIFSDNYRENIEYISKRYDFDKWSKGQFYSFDFQMTKYEKTLFEKVIEILKLPPDEILFIDDSPGKIANGALVGLHAIRFKTNEQVFAEVENLLKY